MDALLTQVLDCVRHPVTVRWTESTLTPAQDAVLERECAGPSDFDQIQSRKTFHAHYKAGHIKPLVRTCFVGEDLVGTVVALLADSAEAQDIPWDLWGCVLALFNKKRAYTVYFCAHPASRQFPEPSRITQPLHINGGYTYPCSHEAIVIYRAEDATRVLIHELFHAACSDNPNQGLEQREAETEAWAELFWCGFMACTSLGGLKSLKSLVRKQAAWMVSQNGRLVRGHHVAPGPQGFPWRYTAGKEAVWRRWGLLQGVVKGHPVDSLRLTFPPTAAMKRVYGVRATSTIL
jgi:hypothetical protein